MRSSSAPWWLSETWNRAVLLTESLFGVRVGLLEDRVCFCAPSLPNGTQTVVIKFEGTNISIKVSPPWPLPTLNELQLFLCACMCVSIHEWAVNDWHQQTGILARAHSSLTTSLLFMMRESAAVSPLGLFTQRFPQFMPSLFQTVVHPYFSCHFNLMSTAQNLPLSSSVHPK